jgi:hypothetical protein
MRFVDWNVFKIKKIYTFLSVKHSGYRVFEIVVSSE